MDVLTKIVNDFQPLTFFAQSSILDVWHGSENASVKVIETGISDFH